MNNRVTINGVESWQPLRLGLTSHEIGVPQPKRYTVDLPAADGRLDLSEAFGGIKYGPRPIAFEFVYVQFDGWTSVTDRIEQVLNAWHGKRSEIRMSWMPGGYFIGRVTVKAVRENDRVAVFTVECDCDPKRYEDAGGG